MEYIIISYGNCNNNIEPMKVSLETKKIDEWDLVKIRSYLIDPTSISSITVGPKTVLEFFYGPSFTGQSHKVINDSPDKVRIYKFFDCPKGNKWSVSLNSFKIWSFDYYDSIFGIRYCDSDKQCDENELCMCESGKANPLWCPKSKRRCMNEKYLYDYSQIPINDEDIINTECLTKQLTNKNLSFEDLKKNFRPCMENKLKYIENFSDAECLPVYKLYAYIFLIILIIIIIMFVTKSVCSYQ